MAHSILDIKQAIQFAFLTNASVAITTGIIPNVILNEVAQDVARIRVSELQSNAEVLGEHLKGYIASIDGRYGAFMFMIDGSKALNEGANSGNIEAVANAGLFGTVGGQALQDIEEVTENTQAAIETNFNSLMSLFEPLAIQHEAFEASRANEDALARGENITGDDEIN